MKTNAFVYRFIDDNAYGNTLSRMGSTNHANHLARDPQASILEHIGFVYESIHWNPYIMFDVVIATRQISKQHVEDIAAQRIKVIEDEHGPMQKKDRKKILTEAMLDYIPQAPIARKRVSVFFADQHLYVQTSSAAVAEKVARWLRTIFNGLPVKTLAAAMADITPLPLWMRQAIHERTAGENFDLGTSGTFTDAGATLRVKNVDLTDDDLWHVIAGKDVKELELLTRLDAFQGGDVVEFTLTDSWQIKNVQNLFEIDGEEWDNAVEQYGDHLAGKILMASVLDDLRRRLCDEIEAFHKHLAGEPLEA